MFHLSAPDTFHAVGVRDDKRWFHYVSEDGNSRLVDSGTTQFVEIRDGERNEVRVLALGGWGLLLVNGEHVARLDLRVGPSSGRVEPFAGYFEGSGARGYTTRFLWLTIGEVALIGDESGALRHSDDDRIEGYKVGASATDFIAIATFTNPYPSWGGAWDYGIAFRGDASVQDTFHAVLLSSDGEWEYSFSDGEPTPEYRESGDVSLDLGRAGQNEIYLIVVGRTGLFFVNDTFVATLEISSGSQTGDVWVGTGFYEGRKRPGASTGYEVQVWSLD